MTIPTFILKNALRNKRRALLSVSSVAVSLFLLVTLQVALRELTIPPQSAGAEPQRRSRTATGRQPSGPDPGRSTGPLP